MLLLPSLIITMESIMKTIIKFTAYILILFIASGCNSDIFIDDFRTSETELTLDGNGDAKVIHFAASNWDLRTVYTYTDNDSFQYKIYDVDGHLIGNEEIPYLKGLGKLVYDEVLTNFNIERSNPDELKITVNKNARASHFRFILIVGNDYETQEIYVEVAPSDRYVFSHITYSLNAYSHEMTVEEGKRFPFYNGLDDECTFWLSPYEGICTEFMFDSDMPEAFLLLTDDESKVEIPSLEDGQWVMKGEQALYSARQQKIPFVSEEKKEIYVLPHSFRLISVMIIYECFETEYTLYAVHPKTGDRQVITGKFQCKTPVDYYFKSTPVSQLLEE